MAPVLPAVLVALWYAVTRDPATELPRPPDVLAALGELVGSGELFTALGISIGRVLAGFALGTITAGLLGILMGRWRLVREIFDPLIETFRPIAAIALVPIAILWFGAGTNAAVFIVSYAAFFPMVVNTVAGVRAVDPGVLDAARTFGVREATILRQVILPSALPKLLVGARLSMGLAWTSVIAAELTVGAKAGGGESGGIGQLMFTYFLYEVDPNPIVVSMIAVGVIGLVLDQLLRGIGWIIMPWRRAEL
jgi:ABC-type nitrate/sulfonate/bicarbonate transport system permease component